MEKEFTEDEELLYLASYVVKQGIYDEIVLCYLRDYFTGSIEDMCSYGIKSAVSRWRATSWRSAF